MRAVIQRVASASVYVSGARVSSIEAGLVAFVGIEKEDTEQDSRRLAEKIVGLRIFDDGQGKMNLALADVGGHALFISNFTLAGDAQKGRRPNFDGAADYETGRVLFDKCVTEAILVGANVVTGQYGEHMQVELVNDGPVTLVIFTKKEI